MLLRFIFFYVFLLYFSCPQAASSVVSKIMTADFGERGKREESSAKQGTRQVINNNSVGRRGKAWVKTKIMIRVRSELCTADRDKCWAGMMDGRCVRQTGATRRYPTTSLGHGGRGRGRGGGRGRENKLWATFDLGERGGGELSNVLGHLSRWITRVGRLHSPFSPLRISK